MHRGRDDAAEREPARRMQVSRADRDRWRSSCCRSPRQRNRPTRRRLLAAPAEQIVAGPDDRRADPQRIPRRARIQVHRVRSPDARACSAATPASSSPMRSSSAAAATGWSPTRTARELAYGGLVMQWFGPDQRDVRLQREDADRRRRRPSRPRACRSSSIAQGHVVTQPVRVHQDFFVFEPEVNAMRPRQPAPAPHRRRRLPLHRPLLRLRLLRLAVSRTLQPRRGHRHDQSADRQRKLAPFPVIMRAIRAWPS